MANTTKMDDTKAEQAERRRANEKRAQVAFAAARIVRKGSRAERKARAEAARQAKEATLMKNHPLTRAEEAAEEAAEVLALVNRRIAARMARTDIHVRRKRV